MFKNITEVKRANKALGHYWFEHSPVSLHKVETQVLGGLYWVESSLSFDQTKREYQAVAASPNGEVMYLHGAERFPTLAEAKAIIQTILDSREV